MHSSSQLAQALSLSLLLSLTKAHAHNCSHTHYHSHTVSLSHAPMLRACVKECTEYWKLSRGILFFLRYVGMTRMQVRASGKALRLVSRPPQVNRWPGLAEANQELNIKGRLIEERVSSKLGPALREYLPKLRGGRRLHSSVAPCTRICERIPRPSSSWCLFSHRKQGCQIRMKIELEYGEIVVRYLEGQQRRKDLFRKLPNKEKVKKQSKNIFIFNSFNGRLKGDKNFLI